MPKRSIRSLADTCATPSMLSRPCSANSVVNWSFRRDAAATATAPQRLPRDGLLPGGEAAIRGYAMARGALRGRRSGDDRTRPQTRRDRFLRLDTDPGGPRDRGTVPHDPGPARTNAGG